MCRIFRLHPLIEEQSRNVWRLRSEMYSSSRLGEAVRMVDSWEVEMIRFKRDRRRRDPGSIWV
jgi:hypothetical protein